MVRLKKKVKRISLTLIFISLICISNIQIFNNLYSPKVKFVNNDFNELDEKPLNSDSKLKDYITGPGVNQSVRIYVSNQSVNTNNNEEYFEIPSLNTDDMYLTYGEFNFTFQNNYTTDYILEENHPLYPQKFIQFNFKDNQYSDFTLTNGTPDGGSYSDLIDVTNANSTLIKIIADQGLINFTITANFTDTEYSIPEAPGNVEFDRTHILGIITALVYRLTADANLTIQLRNFSQNIWEDVIEPIQLNQSTILDQIKYRLVNENLNFISENNTIKIRIILNNSDHTSFTARFSDFVMKSTYAFDLPITNTTYVALEFDLRGKNSSVNGFYAWIRTLNVSKAIDTQLNISLYRANSTLFRDEFGNNLREVDLVPDYDELIDSIEVEYYGDTLNHFTFNPSNISRLNVSNYFIVIKSNDSNVVYSLVTIPWYGYGDPELKTEHQLKTTTTNGIKWQNAKKTIPTTLSEYTSNQLDASPFKLNVTRGYMPSDFIIDGNYTLRIQDLPLNDTEINKPPYDQSSPLTWGLGIWNFNFTTPIEDEITNNFKIFLKWDKNITWSFKFNVSYSVNSYLIENATTSYHVRYDEDPEWSYEYNLNKTKSKLMQGWNYLEFWFVYNDFLNAHNLTNPDGEEILNQTFTLPNGKNQTITQTTLTINSNKFKIVIPNNTVNPSGFYILNLTSFNFINSIHSYINFNETLWETYGFMYGDNISVSANIQDHMLNAPKSGNINVTLFYPNGTKYPNAEFYSSDGVIEESLLNYDFNNKTILNLTTEESLFGQYSLGFFWTNGSAIGCNKTTIYIDEYMLELAEYEYTPNIDSNILMGTVTNKVYENYTILIASINDTTRSFDPNFYPINHIDLNKQFSYDLGGVELPVLIKSFKQSEDVLNPEEKINIKTSIQNLHPFIPLNVKINVKLMSYANEEWIITENTSDSILLNFSGTSDDTYELDLNITMPSLNNITKVWHGLNGPVRLAGAKTEITVFIEGYEAGSYAFNDISLLSNKTKNNFDGNIIAVNITEETDKRPILSQFERNESLYLPNNATFLVNIFDQNYVSSYNQFTADFFLNLHSEFSNITINPKNPVEGQAFYISSILTDEFGAILPNKIVSCQYYNNNSWKTIGSDITNENGSSIFNIDPTELDYEDNLLMQIYWNGDIINGVSKQFTIEIIDEINDLSISIKQNKGFIYRNSPTTLTLSLKNIGNSTLRINNISIHIEHNLMYSIVEANYLALNKLKPGDLIKIIIKVNVKDIKRFEINVSIIAQNIFTNEDITVTKESIYKVYDLPIYNYFIEYFIIIIGGIFVLIWIAAIMYSRRVLKIIEAPVEEVVKKRPRRAKYVKVSELKTPVKEVPYKEKALKETEAKQITDLDSLLEEEGLNDKKNNSKK